MAITFDGQLMRCFVDGKSVDATPFQIVPGSLSYRIGGTGRKQEYENGYGREYEGSIDEVRISSVARYTADFKPSLRHEVDEQTLAVYHFDEGEGDVAHDASPHGHHLKLESTRWLPR